MLFHAKTPIDPLLDSLPVEFVTVGLVLAWDDGTYTYRFERDIIQT